MAVSMTGFGRGEANGRGYRVTVELKSVNHRFLEVVARLPRPYGGLEDRVRKVIQASVRRGRIEVYINTVETEERKRLVKVDKELALSYDKTLKELASTLQTSYDTDIYRLAVLPEVLEVEEPEVDLEAVWQVWAGALEQALDRFNEMRRAEGVKLAQDMQKRLEGIGEDLGLIEGRAETLPAEYREKLKERIQILLAETVVDEARLLNEAAFFADKVSITEELVRLRSHIMQSGSALQAAEPSGRKLDFLLQEMNREINTIGSKANDLAVAEAVIRVKSELEKIREQVQNIE
ncbi:hypothetical protein CEB3_c33680 [Peptococcaceae bacterium CEB3]|nr:hypothetical protein CEB3_c33680 [Peptococcaceae bacterium CEB3]